MHCILVKHAWVWVGEEAKESKAVYSTEEMQAKMVAQNTILKGEQKYVGVGSMDVVSLYPNLKKVWVAKILRIMMLRTEVVVKEVDWREDAIYLASTHTQQ